MTVVQTFISVTEGWEVGGACMHTQIVFQKDTQYRSAYKLIRVGTGWHSDKPPSIPCDKLKCTQACIKRPAHFQHSLIYRHKNITASDDIMDMGALTRVMRSLIIVLT